MKTVFAQPSNTYSIELSKEDLITLVSTGVLYYEPSRTSNTYISRSDKVTDSDGHFLQYHGPEPGTIPAQYVVLRLEKDQ